jgi:hypothetical protein
LELPTRAGITGATGRPPERSRHSCSAGISFALQKLVVSLRFVLAFDAGGAWQEFVRALPRHYLYLRLSRCSVNRLKAANK